jgi:RNA polymerase sigma-70 factor (ECF subfamily)
MNVESTKSDARRQLLGLLPRLRRYALISALQDARADTLVELAIDRTLVSIDHRDPAVRMDRWAFGILQMVWQEYPEKEPGLTEIALKMRTNRKGLGRSDLDLTMSNVRETFEHLPIEQRQALFLTIVEGFTYREVADQLGMQTAILVGHITRGRLALIGSAPTSGIDPRLSSSEDQ